MVKITSVISGSHAARAGVKAGDGLVSINKNEINDVLDYRFYLTEKRVELLLLREGKMRRVKIKKGEYDDIGLVFKSALMDEKHSCKNKCIFCFIDQNPEGMRDTVYFKDDDSRLSFLHGNYITLTNMTDSDVERIIKMRISPVNVSIHTTNPSLRVQMMKNKRSGEVLDYLRRFRDAGISMCGQIVLCKDVNDGEELLRSMHDLAQYYPELSSVSVVPAGLTKHRDGLFPLADFTKDEAGKIIDMIDEFAEEHKKNHGSRLFFAADEFYLKAARPLPETEYYEEYPQIENGVGMLRSFMAELDTAISGCEELISEIDTERRVAVATSYASYPMIASAAERLSRVTDKLKLDVYKIKNEFFGESITVAGLMTGTDILNQLAGKICAEELLLPAAALRRDDLDFLCGMTLAELSEKLGVPIRLCENDGFDFVDAVFGVLEDD